MRRVLITGMSGTGKSTVTGELAARGYRAIDLDDPAWSEHARPDPRGRFAEGGRFPDIAPDLDWMWREERVGDLLEREAGDVLFVSGCAPNQGRFYAQLDHIVLITAPLPVLRDRLATRATNDFGKTPESLAKILDDVASVEPALRAGATLEVDTSVSLDEVMQTILEHVGVRPGTS